MSANEAAVTSSFSGEFDALAQRENRIRIIKDALNHDATGALYEILPGVNGHLYVLGCQGISQQELESYVQSAAFESPEHELTLLWNSKSGKHELTNKQAGFFKGTFADLDLKMEFSIAIPPRDGVGQKICKLDIGFYGVKLPTAEAHQINATNPHLFAPEAKKICQIQ